MGFSISYVGNAGEINLGSVEGSSERESAILAVVHQAAVDIAQTLDGEVSVSVNGSLNSYPGGVGDNLNIQVNSMLPPKAPAQDAGLNAAGGSARNAPPEASTAAPATEGVSPPAAQEPIPQPAVEEAEPTAVLQDAEQPAESAPPAEDAPPVPGDPDVAAQAPAVEAAETADPAAEQAS